MKKILLFGLIIFIAIVGGSKIHQYLNNNQVSVTIPIETPALVVGKNVADNPIVLPEKTPIKIDIEQPEITPPIQTYQKEVKTASAVTQATKNDSDDIESPNYVFKPIPGVEYKNIWFKVPQQDLKYIKLPGKTK